MKELDKAHDLISKPNLIKSYKDGQLVVSIEALNKVMNIEKNLIKQKGIDLYIMEGRDKGFAIYVELFVRFRQELFGRNVSDLFRERVEKIREFRLDLSNWPQESYLIENTIEVLNRLRIPENSRVRYSVKMPSISRKPTEHHWPLRNQKRKRPRRPR